MPSIWISYFIALIFLVQGIDVQMLEGGDRLNNTLGLCESMDIRNSVEKLEMLNNCTIIVGSLQIVLLERLTKINYAKYVFPKLREVTQFILLYRLEGIHSLGQLFPNLAIIRGQKLLHDYALVIFELPQLREIGLRSLTVIQRGTVRIAQNPQLCYSQTVNWTEITGQAVGHFIHANGPASCPGYESCRGCDYNLCWSSMHCQRLPSPICHPECLGGCTPNTSKCYSCKNFVDNGVCVPQCPLHKYEHPATSICVTEKQCKKLYRGTGWVWRKSCIRKCPKSYKTVVVQNVKTCEFCGDKCNVTCLGNEVQTLDEVQYYKGCNFINGSLYIRFIGDNSFNENVMQELLENFQDVQEIKGILKVFRSTSITSLNFFKNLTVIHGNDLMFGRYALAVHEMSNLQSLFDEEVTKKIKIIRGTLFFHYNAKLCLKEIEKLRVATNKTVLTDDVSRGSNGYESHCHFLNIKTDFKVLGTKTVEITWERILQPNHTNLQLGYLIYYMEEPNDMNLTHFSRSTCYEKGWKTIYVEEPLNTDIKVITTNLTKLNSYTDYAYYVESYYKATIMTQSLHDGQSEIKFFKTDMDYPRMPLLLEASSPFYNMLSATWQDDPTYRGVITHYLIEVVLQNDDKDHLDQRNYCVHPLVREIIVPKKKIQFDLLDEYDTPKKTRKCYCTNEEWNNNAPDKGLLEVSRTYLQKDKDDFRAWCDQRHMREPPKDTEDIIKEFNCFKLNKNDNNKEYEIEDEDVPLSRSERSVDTFDIQDVIGKATPRTPIENVIVDNVHHAFSTHFFESYKNFTLGSLKHYGQYLIYVSACKGSVGNDCGPYTVIAHRTKADPQKDIIDNLRVDVLSNNSVHVLWNEPPNPNGAIVSYTLEYFKNDKTNNKSMVHCITRKELENHQWKYHLILAPGKYGVKVRAHSLGYDGDFTQIYYFSTESNLFNWLIFFGIVIIIACFSVGFWCWYQHAKGSASPTDTARLISQSMNVRYIDCGSTDNLDRIDFYNLNSY